MMSGRLDNWSGEIIEEREAISHREEFSRSKMQKHNVITARWFRKDEFPAHELLEHASEAWQGIIDVVKAYYRGTYVFAARGFAEEHQASFGEWYLPNKGVDQWPWVVNKIGKDKDEEIYSYFYVPQEIRELSANIIEKFSMGSNRVLRTNAAGQITCEGVFRNGTLLHSHQYSYDGKGRITGHVLGDCAAFPVINVFCGRREWQYDSIPPGVTPDEKMAKLLASLAFEWMPVPPLTGIAYYLCGTAKAYDLAGDLYREFRNSYDEQGRIAASEHWQETYSGMKHFASSRYDYSVAGKILKHWCEPDRLDVTTTIVLDETELPVSQTEDWLLREEDEEPGGYPADWDDPPCDRKDATGVPLVLDREEPYYTERITWPDGVSIRQVRMTKRNEG